MPTEILMPALSPTMEEGTLAKWLVKEGDTVQSGDLLAEIETDKATMEFEAVDEGTIGKLLVDEGTAGVAVNTAIAVLLEDGESADDIDASAGSGGGSSGGDKEKAADSSDGKSEEAPKAKKSGGGGSSAPAPESDTQAPAAGKDKDGNRIFASPLARRIAADKGLDLSEIKGSGPKGRIVKDDVMDAKPSAKKSDAPAASSGAAAPAAAAAPTGPSADAVAKMFSDRDYEEVQLNGMRKTIASRLSEAKQTIPHFYLRRSAKLDALMDFRKTLNKQLEARGVKLSVNDFIIKASALALQEVPDANAVWAGDRIFKLKPSDVAVAVAIEGGLFTPVLKDAHQKTLSTLSAEMKDLASRARDRKLAPHEYQGGSFAISNLGMFGIENFDAVINPPHGSILAIGAGLPTPVIEEGEVVTRNVMSMTLSVDHRVIDGALGAQFLDAIIKHLENPVGMLA